MVGSSYSGGTSYKQGLLWSKGNKPEMIVDLGEPKKAAAFRVHLHGFPGQDAIKGQITDDVEVFTSTDGTNYTSQGKFDFRLYWKDIPVNYMYTDEETFKAHNFLLQLPEPVETRYVKYVLNATRYSFITELQVLDGVKFEPFDLRIALPNKSTNGMFPQAAGESPNAKQFKPEELPADLCKERKKTKSE